MTLAASNSECAGSPGDSSPPAATADAAPTGSRAGASAAGASSPPAATADAAPTGGHEGASAAGAASPPAATASAAPTGGHAGAPAAKSSDAASAGGDAASLVQMSVPLRSKAMLNPAGVSSPDSCQELQPPMLPDLSPPQRSWRLSGHGRLRRHSFYTTVSICAATCTLVCVRGE